MGFSVMLRDAEKLVPVEYWCPYGYFEIFRIMKHCIYKFANTYCYCTRLESATPHLRGIEADNVGHARS